MRCRRRHVARLLMAIGLSVAAAPAGADDTQTLRQEALQRLGAGEFDAAAELLDRYVERVPDDGVMLYNAACAQSRIGALERAEGYLLGAVQAGFVNFSRMRRDCDLASLRDRPAYRALLAARDAADPILADRQVDLWRGDDGSDQYRYAVDVDRRINFVIGQSGLSVERVQSIVARQLDHLGGAWFDDPSRHTLLIALPEPAVAVDMFDAHVRGSYRHASRVLVTTDVDRSMRHELCHAAHHAHMDELGQTHPMWIQEGLACLAERIVVDAGGTVQRWPTERESIVASLDDAGRLLPWDTLFTLTPSAFRSQSIVTYAQAHSVLLYLDEQGLVADWYRVYVDRHAEDPTGALAIETVLGVPLAAAESEWRAWLRRRDVGAIPDAVVTAEIDSAPAIAAAGPPEPAELAEGLFEAVSEHYEAGQYEAAIPWLQEVTTLAPTHANAHYVLGLAYIRTEHIDDAWRQHEILMRLDASLGSLLGNLVGRRGRSADP